MYLASVGSTLAALGLSRLIFNLAGNQTIGVALVGKANIFLSLALLSGLPASAGLAMALSRFVPLLDRAGETARALRVSSSFGFLAVLAVFVPTVVIFQRSSAVPIDWPTALLLLAWTWCYAQYALGRAVLFARGQVRRVLTLELLGFTLFFLSIMLCVVSASAWWVPFSVYPLPIALSSLADLGTGSARATFAHRREFLNFAGLGLLGSAAGQGIQYGSTLAGAAFGGPAAAGLWATLLSVSAPVLLLPRSLNTSYLPRLAASHADTDTTFARTSTEHQRISSVAALPAAVGLLIAGILWGTRWFPPVPGIDPLPVWTALCAMTFITCRGEPILTAIAARGRAGINAGAALIGGAICALAWILGRGQDLGLFGIAIGLVAYSLTVPCIAAAIAAVRLGDRGPVFVPQFADAAAVAAFVLLVLARQAAWGLMAGISVTLLGTIHQAWRLLGRPRPQ